MKKAEVMSFGKPDVVRKFPKGHLELINIGGATVGRAVFESGWKWSGSHFLINADWGCLEREHKAGSLWMR